MTTNVNHNEASCRYELTVDDELIGIADYRRDGDLFDFVHTEIAASHEGRGHGSALVGASLDDVKRQGLTVLPSCWFMRDHIAEHPGEYLALVPADRRAHFGLPMS